MTDADLQAQIAAATAYEQYFVRALFGEWAPRVAAAAQLKAGQHVLDVACGTGVLAREAAGRVTRAGFVAGLDASAAMLTVANVAMPTIEWRQGTAEALPYPDERFDAVVSQFGLMFFSDRGKALTEMCRVLKPHGRLALAVWASLDRMPAYAAEVELLEQIAGTRAADALRAPFVLGDAQHVRDLMASAGASDVVVTTQSGVARFPSLRFMVEADLRGWLPIMGVVLPEDQIQLLLHEAEDVLAPYATSAGPTAFEVAAHIVTGAKA